MREYKSLVKCYQRKKSRQYLITLKGDHGFKPDEPVVVLPEDGFSELVALQDTAWDHKNELLLKDKEISQVKLDLQSSRDEVETKTRALIEHESRVSVYEDNIDQRQGCAPRAAENLGDSQSERSVDATGGAERCPGQPLARPPGTPACGREKCVLRRNALDRALAVASRQKR